MIGAGSARRLEEALGNYYRPLLRELRSLADSEMSLHGQNETEEVRGITAAANMVENAIGLLDLLLRSGGRGRGRGA